MATAFGGKERYSVTVRVLICRIIGHLYSAPARRQTEDKTRWIRGAWCGRCKSYWGFPK